MTERKDNSIPNDSERRRALWISENLPQFSDDYEVEATQTINPITGREYDYHSRTRESLEFSNYSLEKIFLSGKNSLLNHFYCNDIRNIEPTTNEFLEYQFALAIMDVADGKLSKDKYSKDRKNAKKLVTEMNQAGMHLSLINEPHSFNLALNKITKDKEMRAINGRVESHYELF